MRTEFTRPIPRRLSVARVAAATWWRTVASLSLPAIVGSSRDGIERRVALDSVDPEDKKRLLETVPAAAAAPKEGGQ